MEKIKLLLLSADAVKKRYGYALEFIGAERAERAARFKNENDRLLSVGAAYLVKKYVGETRRDKYGKPRARGMFFGVSHSAGLIGLALSDKYEIGLDIEKAGAVDDDVALFCFSNDERRAANVADMTALFDPLKADEPDVNADISERKEGGLGIMLVKTLSDDVSYSVKDGKNSLKLTKKLI